MNARPSQTRKSWEAMTAAEKGEAALPLLRNGKSFGEVAALIGAPSRNAIATVAARLVKAGRLPAATRQGRKAARKQPSKSQGKPLRPEGGPEAHSRDMAGLPADSRAGDRQPNSRQRENVPSQHEVWPGSTSLGTEQQCDTLGVTAGRVPASNSPSSPSTSSRSETPAGAAEPPPSAVPALLSVKDSRSNKKVRGGKPNTNRIAAVRSKSEASIDRHIARRMKARIEMPKVDPGLPITITKAAAFDPLPGVEPVAFGTERCCKWAVDGYDGTGLLWCGAPREPGQPWCANHRRIAYQPSRQQEEAA